MSNFIKIGDKYINTDQIVSITQDLKYYYLRMSNVDLYRVDVNKANTKLIQGVLNANIQLPSERTTKRTDRSV